MYNHSKAQQSKNRVHISWDILYAIRHCNGFLQLLHNNPITRNGGFNGDLHRHLNGYLGGNTVKPVCNDHLHNKIYYL